MLIDPELPSMKALVAFEATVRRGSMSAAARELDISQPLVSQRIRALEEDLGIVLVDRTTKPVCATPLGEQFYAQIAGSVTGIKAAVVQMKRASTEQAPRIRISAPFGFMFYWILPKLQILQSQFENIQFDIQPWMKTVNEKIGDSDIVFDFGKSEGMYRYEKQIIPQIVRPVCSPSFAQAHGLVEKQSLHSNHDYPLLHMDENNASWLNWEDWAKILNIKTKKAPTTFYYNNYPLLVDAIKADKGIGLGWYGLIDPLIEEGQLFPLGPEIRCDTRGYLICTDYYHTHLVKTLVDWFEAQVKGADPF